MNKTCRFEDYLKCQYSTSFDSSNYIHCDYEKYCIFQLPNNGKEKGEERKCRNCKYYELYKILKEESGSYSVDSPCLKCKKFKGNQFSFTDWDEFIPMEKK